MRFFDIFIFLLQGAVRRDERRALCLIGGAQVQEHRAGENTKAASFYNVINMTVHHDG
jgi:hypothetical protein